MTYSRDWRNYPPAFKNLVETAAVRKVVIPAKDEKDALRLQNKLHAFFGTVHRNAAKDPALIPLDNLTRKVRVKAIGATVECAPRDEEPDNALILSALEQAPASDASVPMSAEMQELFGKGLTS